MNPTANRDYLEQKINTASSAQLHLMLIEGAMRFANRADQLFEANDIDNAAEPLMRAMDISSELLAGVKHSQDEVNVKLAAIYQFIFTRLTMAYVNTDREKLVEAIRILDTQRETWRQACEIATTGDGESKSTETPAAKAEAPRGPHKPAPIDTTDLASSGGLSLEA